MKFGQYHQKKHRNLSQAVQVAKKIQNRKQFQQRIIFSEIVRLELLLFENYVKRFALNPFRFAVLHFLLSLSQNRTIPITDNRKIFSDLNADEISLYEKKLVACRRKNRK